MSMKQRVQYTHYFPAIQSYWINMIYLVFQAGIEECWMFTLDVSALEKMKIDDEIKFTDKDDFKVKVGTMSAQDLFLIFCMGL